MTKKDQLQKITYAIMVFDELDICKTATNPVPGEGNPEARIVFVGEAPGANEDKLGRPFVGRAGQLLDKMISLLGLRRDDVYITNIIKWRPPENRDSTPDEIEKSKKFLTAQLSVIRPRVVVPLGRFSMYFMLGTEEYKISEAHGKLFEQTEAGFFVYPVYHPAAALRRGDFYQALQEDFLKLKKFLKKENLI